MNPRGEQENLKMTHTPEQIARRIVALLDERHTMPGEYDMFGAIAARLANEEIHGEVLDGGVAFGVERQWFSLKGPRLWRTAVAPTSPT